MGFPTRYFRSIFVFFCRYFFVGRLPWFSDEKIVNTSMVFNLENSEHFGRTDERTDGRAGGRTDERTDGRTVGRTDGRTVGRPDGRTDGRTIGRTDGRTAGRTDGRTDGRTVGRTDGRRYLSS